MDINLSVSGDISAAMPAAQAVSNKLVQGMDSRCVKSRLNLMAPYSHGGHQPIGWARHGALLNLETSGAVMKQLNEQEVMMVAGAIDSTSDPAEIAAFFEAQRKQREEELARLARDAMK